MFLEEEGVEVGRDPLGVVVVAVLGASQVHCGSVAVRVHTSVRSTEKAVLRIRTITNRPGLVTAC